MTRIHSQGSWSGRWLLAWSFILTFLFSSSKHAIVEAQLTTAVPLPAVDLYMLCQISLKQEANNIYSDNNVLSSLPRYSTSELFEAALEEYFVDLIGPDASSVDIQVDTTIDSCIASDLLQVQATSSGVINLYSTSTLSEGDIPPLVTQDSLKEGFDSLCNSVLSVQSTVRLAEEAELTSSKVFRSEGSTRNLSKAVCGLTEEDVGLSLSVILIIVFAPLIALCGIFCCCFCRRNKG